MPSRWYQIQEVGLGSGSDPHRPDYVGGIDIDKWVGNKTAPSGAPWVVKVYGTTIELDTLSSKSGTTELSSVPSDALNQITGLNRYTDEWDSIW